MKHRVPLWAVAGLVLTLAGLAWAQGYQPNFLRNLFAPIITGGATVSGTLTADTVKANVLDGGTGVITGPLTVSGQSGLQGVTSGLTRVLQLDAGNVTVVNPGRICTDIPCTTNYFQNDGAGSLSVTGPFSGNSNWATGGNVTGAIIKVATSLQNTGTAANCTNTAAVCIDDPAGLEVTVGSALVGGATLGTSGAAITASFTGSGTLDFASALSATCSADLTITVTGATTSSVVDLSVPNGSVAAGSMFFPWVSATNTVSVRHCCITGVSCDPASGTFIARVFVP